MAERESERDKKQLGEISHATGMFGIYLTPCEALCRNLAKKAQGAITQREKLEQKMKVAKLQGKGNQLSAKLSQARKNESKLLDLAEEIKILLYWLRNDILSLAGPEWSDRMELINFIISELKQREDQAHKGI